jgi:hypothetical protein
MVPPGFAAAGQAATLMGSCGSLDLRLGQGAADAFSASFLLFAVILAEVRLDAGHFPLRFAPAIRTRSSGPSDPLHPCAQIAYAGVTVSVAPGELSEKGK